MRTAGGKGAEEEDAETSQMDPAVGDLVVGGRRRERWDDLMDQREEFRERLDDRLDRLDDRLDRMEERIERLEQCR